MSQKPRIMHAIPVPTDELFALKMQRRLMEESLLRNRDRIVKLSETLKKKEEEKKARGAAPPDPATTTKVLGSIGGGMSGMREYRVDDFRVDPHKRKEAKVLKKTTHEDVDPSPVTNEAILRIRHEHLQRVVCSKIIKKAVVRQEAEKEKKKVEAFNALPRAERKVLPKISVPPSMLPNRYVRGELPCTIEHGISGHYLSWAAPLDNLDYEYYLPIFFDGLQCKKNPARFLARQGIEDMLFACKGYPDRIIPCIHALIRPIRNALSKFDRELLLGVLKAINQLLLCNDGIGEALLPYSKQFLAPFASFLEENKHMGDKIDYAQRKDDDIGENVRKTLELLEEKGGPNAYQSIKFSIPLYESCLKSKKVHHDTASFAPTGMKDGHK